MREFFFDTYALLEMSKGNKNYAPYQKEVTVILTKLNLMELHYSLLRTCSKEEANQAYDELIPFAVEISDEIIKMANQVKLLLKKRKLSYVDCIGYTIAGIRGIKFLTGDQQFWDLENVEFVK